MRTTVVLQPDIVTLANNIKEELHISFSELVAQGIKEIAYKIERKKWEEAMLQASKDPDYMAMVQEEVRFGDFN